MSAKRYAVRLTQREREHLNGILSSDRKVARKKRIRAQVFLKVDEGEQGPAWTDERVAEAFDLHINSVHSMRKDLVVRGLEEALERRPQATPRRQPVLDAKREKKVLTLAVSKAPQGQARWSLRMLADELVRLDIVESVSHETVRKVLKKGICSRIAK